LTVCGNAAGEICPLFTGAPIRAHWGLPDPADVGGSVAEVDAAFAETWRLLEMRVKAMIGLSLKQMEPRDIHMKLNAIGKMEGAA
jgi:arsenate reductase